MVESGVNPGAWEDRCVHSECTLHQLSPFLGKMKSSMASELIDSFSEEGQTILDPFSGSGTVPLEAALSHRNSIGIDRNPYALLLTKAKLNPPNTQEDAIEKAEEYLRGINPDENGPTDQIPRWVREFYHPKTLSGIEQISNSLRSNDEYFLMACLMGILHHQRPGFLSYPASHLRPYLRDEKFPREDYPEQYGYREIGPRLISKIERAYRRAPRFNEQLIRSVEEGNAPEVMRNRIDSNSVDAIITSPPYMNKLDYGRDNRLRLFFLGVTDYKELDGSPESKIDYRQFLEDFLSSSERVLSPTGRLVFVLGESRRSGDAVDTSEVLIDVVKNDRPNFSVLTTIQDKVPVREINSMSSQKETILALEYSG